MMHTRLTHSRLLIVGTVRNCEKSIEKTIQTLVASCSQFKETFFFIVESDSSDKTLQILNRLSQQNPYFQYVSLGNLCPTHPKRTDRLALCRNRYLDEIRENEHYETIDYVLVVDLDGVTNRLTPQSLQACWELTQDWDALFANSSGRYYDIWALRHPIWCPTDCWQAVNTLKNVMSETEAKELAIYSKMVKIYNNSPLIMVDSAFGGLGIYKKHLMLESRYDGLTPEGEECCEHVAFHQGLRAKNRLLFINPALITCDEIKAHMRPWRLF